MQLLSHQMLSNNPTDGEKPRGTYMYVFIYLRGVLRDDRIDRARCWVRARVSGVVVHNIPPRVVGLETSTCDGGWSWLTPTT